MDSYYPTIGFQKNHMEYYGHSTDSHMEYRVLPRGVMAKENDELFANPYLDKRNAATAVEEPSAGETYFDFREKDHLYYLIGYY